MKKSGLDIEDKGNIDDSLCINIDHLKYGKNQSLPAAYFPIHNQPIKYPSERDNKTYSGACNEESPDKWCKDPFKLFEGLLQMF